MSHDFGPKLKATRKLSFSPIYHSDHSMVILWHKDVPWVDLESLEGLKSHKCVGKG